MVATTVGAVREPPNSDYYLFDGNLVLIGTRMALAAGGRICRKLELRPATTTAHRPPAPMAAPDDAPRPPSQDCIYLLFIYDKNVLIKEKQFAGTISRRCPEVP
jgi:hypothetical protein